MENLKNFLHPKRKENLKFVLSPAFTDDEGNPLEWEIRELTAAEGMEISSETKNLSSTEMMMRYVAEALVVPNLKDAELVKMVAEESGGKIKAPYEILQDLLTDAEAAELFKRYNQQNSAGKFEEQVDAAKN